MLQKGVSSGVETKEITNFDLTSARREFLTYFAPRRREKHAQVSIFRNQTLTRVQIDYNFQVCLNSPGNRFLSFTLNQNTSSQYFSNLYNSWF